MKSVLCYGDSNTWGYDFSTYIPELGSGQRLSFNERWPGIAQKYLGSEYRIIEDALNGRTVLAEDPYFPFRNGMKSLKIALDAHAPIDLIAIQIGVNELKQMFNLSAGMIAYGVEKMVEEAGRCYYGYPAPKVLLISPARVRENISDMIFGFNFGPNAYEKSKEFGKLYKEIALRHDCGFLDCEELNFELNDLDGLHYCRNDHNKLGRKAAEVIRAMLN